MKLNPESIAKGYVEQLKLVADNIYIRVNVKEAERVYARKLNKYPSKLTRMEKQQAFIDAVLEEV